MKSSREDLVKRGYFDKYELEKYSDFTEEELNILLNSENA